MNMWSGLVFSITFLFSAIASPFWGGLADRKGRKNHAATLCVGYGCCDAADGTGAKISGSS
ncbi:Multidrug-efflux transporter, major facilitator superfamily (MFS) (TC 2.A.1) [Citrobacter freundii]|uniref:Multidrug-efflux transporter, major facilitator superfamily (MFS) (TC 2.A.1) n=1 Tax=Citrobacter freundii TaxID=546 RepID=A0A7G2ITY4_CITFR|nr:Multidrug-efflux transporter, major facilitator superfamily (MFS) (TC 2.A.1) [Citrobacter freundii]